MMTKRQIALDASSTTIGWVLGEDGQRRFSGTQKLKGELEARIEQAYSFTLSLLNTWIGAEILVTEAPGGRFMKGVLPQVRVNGVIILACRQRGVTWGEVSAKEAKLAFAGSGIAKKPDVILAAAPILGYDPAALVIKGSKSTPYRAFLDGKLVYDENEADALAILSAIRS